MKEFEKPLSIITGVGYRDVNTSINHSNIFFSNNIKPNIGAWVSKLLFENGYDLLMVSRTESKLKDVKEYLENQTERRNKVDYVAIDLLDDRVVIDKVINNIKGREVNLVHCVGLSSGLYNVPNDNPYLEITDTPLDLPVIEFEIVVKSLLILVKALLPILKNQKESRIVVVSSMSGIRAFPRGYSHASAKAGLHHAVRSLTLELNKSSIFVSEVLPGIVNTGLYDNPHVRDAVINIAESFGYRYDELPQIPPKEVAEAVKFCLTSKAHVLSINMVSKGQWPNLGA